MSPLDRRDFLMAGGSTLLGLAVAACSKGETGDKKVPPDKGTIADLTKGKAQGLQIAAVQPNLVRDNDRLSIALLTADGAKPFQGGTASAWLATSRTTPATGPIALTYHGEGFDRGTYIGRASFPTEGSWLLYVEAKPEGAPKMLTGGTTLQVTSKGPGQPGKPPQPVPGEKAVSVATPTTAAGLGVEPICTRKPPCSMHQVSLDKALKAGKPTVLLIGTPAFCQTRFCGPVTDAMMKVKAGFLGSKASFVHIELFADNKEAPARQILAPAAQAWRIEAEPVIYYIKADGTIADWAIGPSDPAEIAQITRSLFS